MKECKCQIADLKIRIKHIRNSIGVLTQTFQKEFCNADIEIISSDEKIDYELSVLNEDDCTRGCAEYLLVERGIAEKLPYFSGFLLHSASFDVDGVGVAFAAHSGTGKSTHMMLWQKLLGERMTVVNGDKPIVRIFDDKKTAPEGTALFVPYIYGNPWMGKEMLGCNMRSPLKHICFIERSDKNYVKKISKKDAINRIFNQVYMPKDPVALADTIRLIDRTLSSCSLWIIHCNMEPEAANIAYNTIFSDKKETI